MLRFLSLSSLFSFSSRGFKPINSSQTLSLAPTRSLWTSPFTVTALIPSRAVFPRSFSIPTTTTLSTSLSNSLSTSCAALRIPRRSFISQDPYIASRIAAIMVSLAALMAFGKRHSQSFTYGFHNIPGTHILMHLVWHPYHCRCGRIRVDDLQQCEMTHVMVAPSEMRAPPLLASSSSSISTSSSSSTDAVVDDASFSPSVDHQSDNNNNNNHTDNSGRIGFALYVQPNRAFGRLASRTLSTVMTCAAEKCLLFVFVEEMDREQFIRFIMPSFRAALKSQSSSSPPPPPPSSSSDISNSATSDQTDLVAELVEAMFGLLRSRLELESRVRLVFDADCQTVVLFYFDSALCSISRADVYAALWQTFFGPNPVCQDSKNRVGWGLKRWDSLTME